MRNPTEPFSSLENGTHEKQFSQARPSILSFERIPAFGDTATELANVGFNKSLQCTIALAQKNISSAKFNPAGV